MFLRQEAIPTLAAAYRASGRSTIRGIVGSMFAFLDAGDRGMTIPVLGREVGGKEVARGSVIGFLATDLIAQIGEIPGTKSRKPVPKYAGTPNLVEVGTGYNDRLLDCIVRYTPGSTPRGVAELALNAHGVAQGLEPTNDPYLVIEQLRGRGEHPQAIIARALSALAAGSRAALLIAGQMEGSIQSVRVPRAPGA